MAPKVYVQAFCLGVMLCASIADARISRAKRADNCPTPAAPDNGKVECIPGDALGLDIYCTFTCNAGYQFEGVSDKEYLFVCDVASGFYDTPTTPPCVGYCASPCLNGGTCTGPNQCTCVGNFYGSQCEHSQQRCDDPTPGRFGKMECQSDGNGGKVCVPVCFPTFVFEKAAPAQYTCDGTTGAWTPDVTTVPDCIQDIVHTTTTTTPVPVTPTTDAVCAAWGRNHYRTFDNKIFNFEGNCRYTLVHAPNVFDIMIVNDPNCATGGSCDRKIEIYQGNDEILLSPTAGGPQVQWNGQVITVPGFKDGTIFEKLGNYLTITSSLGYSLKWDGKQGVFTQVVEDLKGKVNGLCGHYNDDATDDFQTGTGQMTSNVADFGVSWKKTKLGDPPCPDVQQPGDCSTQTQSVIQQADGLCNVMMTDPDFTACHQAVDPTPYYQACREDCCAQGVDSCTCDSMEAYSRACSAQAVKLDWRIAGRCEIACPNGQVYQECGSSCVRDCSTVSSVCTDPTCVDGCFCPAGMILNNGQCITPDQCPCEHNGQDFHQGDIISQQCNNCTCTSGAWDCTHETCDKTCSATGDPHYETFDGTRYNFMGTCSYYLMKDRDFSIITDNIQCGHGEASCTKSITIDMNGLNIKLDHNHQLFINGREITVLPYEAPGIKVSMVSSLFMQAVLDNGITILWDGRTRAYIKAPSTFFGKTIGMCGTFDGNQGNDFETPLGNVETNPNAFGNQWKTETSCQDMPETPAQDPCEVNSQRKAQAIALCDNLKSDVFKDCHNIEDVNPFYDDCVYDLCACSDNMKDCMCPNIGSYADSCAAKGVKIDWRLQITECMLQCPPGQEYKVCGRPCERTCRDIALNEDDLCDAKCVEGCNCPDGQTQNDDGDCVPISTCPCIFDGRVYASGYTTLKDTDICVCEGGKFVCTPVNFGGKTIDTVEPLCSGDTVYSDCLSNCPLTCENQNSPPTCSDANCKDGCECIPGFVLDGTKCVNASMCPCYHAGKAFYEGEKYIQDCNECVCTSRRWQCTQKDCPSVCQAYGESHYTTFDGKEYDFQGTCDYVLVQSTQNSPYNFAITTRNAQCGTSGVTCFKQMEFVVGEEGSQDFYKLQLIRGQSVVPDPDSPFSVKEIGDMVYITTPFGVELVWDKQTRVYVRLSTDHMQLVEGLCGNFNHDSSDDFTPAKGGFPVVQPTAFADSWRVQSTCAPSQEITDTCLSNPQRKSWAQLKCSVLNSDLFDSCHNFVAPAPYIKKCEFDACGCDLGGDCECLCTAIAAYAHACAISGVMISWRSNDLCPMQCDDCEVFNPCISTCPKKTCDNRMIYGQIAQDCQDAQGLCFEGCDLHPCADGQVYDSLTEPVTCIPEALCNTTACDINGKKYREGERVDDPTVCRAECEICLCRSGTLEHITFGQCDALYTVTVPPPDGSPTPSSPVQRTTEKGQTTPPFNVVTHQGIKRRRRRR